MANSQYQILIPQLVNKKGADLRRPLRFIVYGKDYFVMKTL